MTEDIHGEEQALPAQEQPAEYPEDLERRFSEPILKGTEGIDKAQVWISAFLVVIAAVVAYSNTFSMPFRAEDRALILENAGIQHFTSFDKALISAPDQAVALFSLGLNEWLLPSTPASFRVVSIGLHALGAVLVFLLCRRLFRGSVSESVAMMAGLLFALHPLATEGVDYLSMRGTLLAAVFSLLSVTLMLRAFDDDSRLRVGAYSVAMLSFVLAWGASPAAAALPLLVTAADWVARGECPKGQRVVAQLGYWALFPVLLTVQWATSDAAATELPLMARLSALYSQFVWTVAPHNLSAYHPLPGGGMQAVWAGIILAVLLCAALLLLWRRSVAGFGLLWYTVLLMASALLVQPGHGLSEYQTYLPLAGIALVLPWAFQLVPQIGSLRTVAGAAAALLMLTAGVGTFSRNQVWQSDEALWRDAAAKYPDAMEPHLRLARALMADASGIMADAAALAAQKQESAATQRQAEAQDQFRVAEEELSKALESAPDDSEALFTLARIQEGTGRAKEAAETYGKVLEQMPGHPEALWRLAVLTQGQTPPSDTPSLARIAEMYRRADETGHLPGEVLPLYGRALETLGAVEEGRDVYARAAALPPSPAQEQAQAALNQLTEVLKKAGAIQQQCISVMQTAPNSADALRLRGQLLSVLGHDLQASYLLDDALRANPSDANAWVLLGVCRARMKSPVTFVREWPTPPQSPAPNTTPWRYLSSTTAATGDWESTAVYLSAAEQAGELAGTPMAVAAADIAAELNQPQRAAAYLMQAAEAAPTDPLPWLRLTDLAIATNDLPTARGYFAKARDRNASPEELAKRKEKLGDVPQAGGPATLR